MAYPLLKACVENWKRTEETLNTLLELEPEQLYLLKIWLKAVDSEVLREVVLKALKKVDYYAKE